ncbi:unnamed protein product [Urochloa humidicola]
MAEMENAQGDEEMQEVPAAGNQQHGRLNWTSGMSTFILRRFTDLVAQGVKTDKGFKDVYLNKVAKELSEFAGVVVTGNQVYNHLRKWRGRWTKIARLKDLSGANWDESLCMITLAPSHYEGHVKDHPKDAEFLNTPLINYPQMEAIFASGVATGRFAMGSTEPLGDPADAEPIDVDGDDAPRPTEKIGEGVHNNKAGGEGAHNNKTRGDTPSGVKRKRSMAEEDSSMASLTEAVWGFAGAVKETIHAEGTPGIVKAVMECNNFTKPQLMFCLDHLMEHKRSALGFLDMDAEQRDLWLTTHLIKNNLLD